MRFVSARAELRREYGKLYRRHTSCIHRNVIAGEQVAAICRDFTEGAISHERSGPRTANTVMPSEERCACKTRVHRRSNALISRGNSQVPGQRERRRDHQVWARAAAVPGLPSQRSALRRAPYAKAVPLQNDAFDEQRIEE
jgi:hypothetical protein